MGRLGELEEARDLLRKAYAAALSGLGLNDRTTGKIRTGLSILEGELGSGD
jgi:hypothetical protein